MTPLATSSGIGRHHLVLVVERQVVDDVLVLQPHAAQAVADDRRHLVGEGRVVGLGGRVDRGQQEAVAVLVLEALAEQRGAPRGGAEQEAPGPGVARLPDEVADPLPAEHRVEGEERHHRHALGRVAGAGGDEAGHRAGLGDALLEDLPALALLVRQQQGVVDGLVLLALRRVDPELLEQRVHAEGAGLVRDDRHDARAELRVAAEVAQQAGERGGGGRRLLARAGQHLVEGLLRPAARAGASCATTRRGSEPSRAQPPVEHVLPDLGALGQRDVGRLLVVGQRVLGHLVLRGGGARAGARSWSVVIFLIWWVALRPSTSGPSVQPLIVLARMTVGAPGCSVAAL